MVVIGRALMAHPKLMLLDEPSLGLAPLIVQEIFDVIQKINQQILKLLYDDVTVVPLWHYPRIAFVDKSVQNTGWFIHGDSAISEFGTRTWLKK